jgi:tRNA1(Val) A37 N6-methylase TrmN6
MTLQGKRAKAPEGLVGKDDAGAATCDAFLGGRLKIHQPRSGPRTGIDAVFLAAAIPSRHGRSESVLEAGTGCGVVALALAKRIEDVRVTGIELQGALCKLAQRNAETNNLVKRVSFIEGDMDAPRSQLEAQGLMLESFDHVAANPPFHTVGNARESQLPAKTRAHMAKAGALDRWIRFLTAMAAPHGSLTLIHRADALPSLLAQLEGRFGALTVFPLYPHKGDPAGRIIVQGVKGSRAPFKIASGMVLHDEKGCYTPEAERVLREGVALDLSA